MDPQLSEMTMEQLLVLIDEMVDKRLTEFWNELRKLDEINQSQIEALIDEVARIEQKLEEILAAPEGGLEILEVLEVREEIIEKPKAQRKSRKKKIPAKEVT